MMRRVKINLISVTVLMLLLRGGMVAQNYTAQDLGHIASGKRPGA